MSTLDFSVGDPTHALAHCAGQVEVQEMSAGIGAVYEEAAVLYANGSDSEAELVLNAVLDTQATQAGEGLWMMLLDLYRLTGQRQRFETRVLDYATRFERSPPPWHDLSSAVERPRSHVAPLVNLSGSLSGQAAAQFGQIAIIGKKSGAIRIDLGRLRSVDGTGCTLFRGVLRELAAERVKVSLLNGSQLVDMLAGQVQPGKAEGRDVWLLLLEMLQHTGEQERFEELAVEYAVTFEESPPSWEPRAEQLASSTATHEVVLDLDAPSHEFTLEGELTSTGVEKIRKLAAHASGLQKVDVDCGQLRRIDFVSAGTLFNILATLQAQGKQVVLRNVNAMVAALLRVMGVDQVAQVILRG
nr:STAS domain-containing protein [Aromatoleum diolicum]